MLCFLIMFWVFRRELSCNTLISLFLIPESLWGILNIGEFNPRSSGWDIISWISWWYRGRVNHGRSRRIHHTLWVGFDRSLIGSSSGRDKHFLFRWITHIRIVDPGSELIKLRDLISICKCLVGSSLISLIDSVEKRRFRDIILIGLESSWDSGFHVELIGVDHIHYLLWLGVNLIVLMELRDHIIILGRNALWGELDRPLLPMLLVLRESEWLRLVKFVHASWYVIEWRIILFRKVQVDLSIHWYVSPLKTLLGYIIFILRCDGVIGLEWGRCWVRVLVMDSLISLTLQIFFRFLFWDGRAECSLESISKSS